jgi:hypothetical protein
VWSKVKAVAHTLPYDASILGSDTVIGNPLPADRWASVTAPALVLCGGKSPEWLRNSSEALAQVLGAEQRTLPRQRHMIKPQVLAPVLAEFFAAENATGRAIHARRSGASP